MNMLTKFCQWYLKKHPTKIENVELTDGFFIIRFDPLDDDLGDIGGFVDQLQIALNSTDKNVGAVFLPNSWKWEILSNNDFLQIWRTRVNEETIREVLGKEAFALYEASVAERYQLRTENEQLKAIVGGKLRGEIIDHEMVVNNDECTRSPRHSLLRSP